MIDGGQQITSIDQHLLNGSELFDTDPKGALAAYYQAVSLEPTHVEGWNQIGRLMFDMQQYSEAQMVFQRVEQLSLQQGLDDWAEMAVQNIELTRQTIAEMPAGDHSAPEPVVSEAGVADLGQAELAPELAASEEHQSIADISNIASATSLPARDETQLLQPETVREIVEETTQSDQSVEEQTFDAMTEPAIASPIMKASAQTIEVLDEPAPVLVPVSTSVPIPSVAIEPPAMRAVSAELAIPDPVVPNDPSRLIAEPSHIPVLPAQHNPSETVGQYTPAIAPVLPATQISFGQHQHHRQVATTPPDVQAAIPPLAVPMPTQSSVPEGQWQSALPTTAPPMPFPAHSGDVLATPLAGDGNSPQTPSMVPPTSDATMDVPKSSSGKIALMITGVVGAVGIGIGVAQYLNSIDAADRTVPVIKSEAKLPVKSVVKAVVVPAPEKVEELAAPAPVMPKILDKDRAYKAGMTHLVKGEFAQARPFLEKAVDGGHAEAAFNLASLYAKGEGVDQNYETAVMYLEKSSNGGYYPAMTNLGLLYAKGQGVKQNYLTARSLWLKAAAGEHADAMHNLAVIYATGKGVEKDMGEAINWYRKGANGGYVDSIFDLGLLYANGVGVTRDYVEAKRLWETAADKGHKLAAKNLEKLNQVMAQ
ncbi:MAG: hypothetical protein GY927_07370 [bacterium]|nr:hypothetical protein [bacterium]